MNDYWQMKTYTQPVRDYTVEADRLAYYTVEEWANIVELITTVERGEPDKLSPKKQLFKLGFGRTPQQ
jgi:hypothetical protein